MSKCRRADWPGLAGGAALALAAVAAYGRTFSVPLLFDDVKSITNNPSVHHLWPIKDVLLPLPSGDGTAGRPLVSLSLALNYAAGGLSPCGYHIFNLVVHILAALTLFGIVRRTLRATFPALVVALLWTVHPLLTESVTCIIQRTESMMGMFYLLTLYCFIRYVDCESPARPACRPWATLSVLACLCGMATKEVMVSAPLLVLLYDRTFVAGSLAEVWRRRRPYYAALASTWLLLVGLVARGHGSRGHAAGFGLGISPVQYTLTQIWAIGRYLRLAFWPTRLDLDYGSFTARASEIVPQALLLAGLLVGTIWALRRRPALGFVGAWFFAILAPSSSVVPLVAQTVAEHRMYLPLAAVIALAVVGVYRWTDWRGLIVCLVLAAGLGTMTVERNRIYQSELAIWSDTAAKSPANPRAHNDLGWVLQKRLGRLNDAIGQYEEALRLKPDYADAHNNLGSAWSKISGRLPQAIGEYEEALRLDPDMAEAHNNLGNALSAEGRTGDAIAEYETAVRLDPEFAEAHNNLGVALEKTPGRLNEAIAHHEEALSLRPDYAAAHFDLGNALTLAGRAGDAIAQYEEALRLKPDYAEAHNNLGSALAGAPGRLNAAFAHYREAVRLRPDYAEAHFNLGNAWSSVPGGLNEAIAEYREALRLRPDYAPVHFNLAVALLKSGGRNDEAVRQLEETLRLNPEIRQARQILAEIRASQP